MPKKASRTKAKAKTPAAPSAWEHPKGSGIRITKVPTKTAGEVVGFSYRVRIPAQLLGRGNLPGVPAEAIAEGTTAGPRKELRETFQRKTKEEAEKLAEDRFLGIKSLGTEFSKLPPLAQKQAAIAWGMLSEHGLDFLQAANAAIRYLRPEGGSRSVAEVIGELMVNKRERFEAKELDKSTLHDFTTRGQRIIEGLGEKPISTVTSDEIIAWLRKLKAGKYSRKGEPLSTRSVLNYRTTLSEVFKHATSRRYCAENPFDRFAASDWKTLGGERAVQDHSDINILTVSEARLLLTTALEHKELGMLPSLVLRLFCGLRTAEAYRSEWSEVHWADASPYVHIPAGKAKKRRVRLVDIPENALAWLKLCEPEASGFITPQGRSIQHYFETFARLAALAGVEWESNDTRHSFGSYHLALHGDSIRTAVQMGHRPNDVTLFASYRTLVKPAEAKEYFGILPTLEASKVTRFPRSFSK